MFTAITTYLFGEVEEESNLEKDNDVSQSEDIIEDWVFVNTTTLQGQCSKETADKKKKMAESWYVTPPSCFEGQPKRDKKHTKISTLENLLIEHPSMSVYVCPNSLTENKADQLGGASPKKTAGRPVVTTKQGDNRQIQHGKIFLNSPANKRVPLKELGCNYENSIAFSSTNKGSKRSNKVHSRLLAGRYAKKESRRNGKHVGMIANRRN